MAKGSTTDHDFLLFALNGVTPSWAGNANVYVGLCNANPTASGNQTTNETSYGSYARVAVAVGSGGWTVTGATGSSAGTITFPTCTSGSDVLTHIIVGTSASGTGQILYFGPLSAPFSVSAGIQPVFDPTTLQITEA